MTDFLRNDNKIRQIQAVSSVPLGLGYSRTTGITVGANNYIAIEVTTNPDSDRLSIWNWIYSVMIDTDSVNNEWPNGSVVNTGAGATDLAYLMDVSDHISYAQSNDRTNVRVHLIRIKNNDGSPHDIIFYYKAFTQAAVTG